MNRAARSTRAFTLIELMIVIAIIATLAAIAIPSLLTAQRSANERSASASLKTLVVAEIDFRNNDRDGNRVADFWTRDVAGLFGMTNVASPGAADEPIRLIELGLAAADSNPAFLGTAANNYRPITQFATQGPKAGYWYLGLYYDGSTNPTGVYWQDTGGSVPMFQVHNTSAFGFCAYPNAFPSGGLTVFAVNESGVVIRSALRTPAKVSTATPPGWPAYPHYYYPSSAMLKASWSKLD